MLVFIKTKNQYHMLLIQSDCVITEQAASATCLLRSDEAAIHNRLLIPLILSFLFGEY